jgi:hypothetical protein
MILSSNKFLVVSFARQFQQQALHLLLRTYDLQLSSSLTLLVLRIDANYPNHSPAVDDLALVTNLFDACSNLHFASPLHQF